MKRTRGLGRGLDALLPATPPKARDESAESYGDGNVFSCPLERIVPQKGQPRQHFDSAKIAELAASIREHGLLEPLVVRKMADGNFELIAGERRFRALKEVGMKEALVVVHEVSSLLAFELAIIENVQREDLDAIELAEALDRLVREHDYTQEKLAERLGKSRSAIANSLRLLKLPEFVRMKVVTGDLTEGHARALLGLDDPKKMEQLASQISHEKLSVRQTEELVRGKKPEAKGGKTPSKKKPKSASTRDLEQRLQRRLGARVEVRDKEGKGEVLIRYGSLDELDRILDIIF